MSKQIFDKVFDTQKDRVFGGEIIKCKLCGEIVGDQYLDIIHHCILHLMAKLIEEKVKEPK